MKTELAKKKKKRKKNFNVCGTILVAFTTCLLHAYQEKVKFPKKF